MLTFTQPGFTSNNNIIKNKWRLLITTAVIFISLCFQLSTFAQNKMIQDKIDPVFRSLINQAREKIVPAQDDRQARVLLREGFASKGALPEKRYECIVYTKSAQVLKDSGIIINSELPQFATAWVTLDQVIKMSLMNQVSFIGAPEIDYLHNDITVGASGAALLQQGRLNNTIYKGKNVIVGIYDTGIDWDHLDFRDPVDTTKSRILRIWDHTITAGTGEAPPSGFSYGVEYTQNQINDELDGTPTGTVRERDVNGHGTHVAGTAAGNGSALPSKRYTGMAPEADIVVIKGGNSSFSESSEIDGITYLKNLATTLGRPVVLNMSIGGQTGAHDGTRANEVAVDNFSASAPGRVIVISAGNDNNANIHNRISLAGSSSGSVSFAVSDSTASDVFRYRIYANDNSSVSATVTVPGGATVTATAGQSTSNPVLSDSFTVVLVNAIDAANNLRYVDFYLQRTNINTRRPTGTWSLSITNNTTNALTMDGWMNYKNSAFTATTIVGGNSDYLVESPGNAASAITAASYTGKTNWYSTAVPGSYLLSAPRLDSISSFSARGPRRDGVLKPELAADGEVIVSCLSSDVTYTAANVVETGLYTRNQGTSMSAPGITGAVALLLQANPGATFSQIKSFLTATANKDAMTELTGATPNTTWGYGKLDVFKAASLLFGCAPSEHAILKYDSSTRNGQETSIALTTSRIAERFTPDLSGKLGGVFFQTHTTSTALFIEVRTNDAGNPGTLLGTLNIDSSRIGKYSFNYIDLSNLNITVTSGTDYFIVLARSPASSATWSLRGEALMVDGRSLQSTNGGTSWTALTTDYRIRSVVYNNGQIAGNIATVTSTDARNINTSSQFINGNCQLIDQVIPNGINPVSGTLTSKVWIEGAVPHYLGNPYVQRHYEITPPSDASTATARVTLYFTQAEFTAFNNDPLSVFDLPTGPADAIGISHLRIGKYSGTSSDNTGSPASYTAPAPVLDPADGDIVWNASANRWEVSFDITGFSGFIVQSIPTILPIFVEYFKGNTQGTANILNWKINCINSSATFDVERSDNGINFSNIGVLVSTTGSCSQPFSFKDATPLQGNNYYRIRITESNGNVTYTNTLLLQNGSELVSRLYPTVMSKGAAVQVSFSGTKGTLNIFDAIGKQVSSRTITRGVQSLNLGLEGGHIYFFNIRDDKRILSSGKIIVE